MPNHVTNIIRLVGKPLDVDRVIDMVSTTYPRELYLSHDGDVVCKDIHGNLGWHKRETDRFTLNSDREAVIVGLPPGWFYEYREEWTRFPDFEKIFEKPAILEAVGEVDTEIVEHATFFGTCIDRLTGGDIDWDDVAGVNNLMYKVLPKNIMEWDTDRTAKLRLASRAYVETGHVYWYTWQKSRWGTKWNAYDCGRIDHNTFTFSTAWCGVPDLILELSKRFPTVVFEYTYADEDISYNTATAFMYNGGVGGVYAPEGGSRDAWELYFKTNPASRKDYTLVGGQYKYLE